MFAYMHVSRYCCHRSTIFIQRTVAFCTWLQQTPATCTHSPQQHGKVVTMVDHFFSHLCCQSGTIIIIQLQPPPPPHSASCYMSLFICVHIGKCASAPRKHHQRKLQQVMTTMSANGVLVLVDGRKNTSSSCTVSRPSWNKCRSRM